MKRVFCMAAVLVIFSLNGCKKDSTNDPVSPFKNTIWTGDFQYNGGPSPEPYSLQFDENGSFTWREFGLSIKGTWNLAGKLLTLTFSNGNVIKADVPDDKTFSNIQNIATNERQIANGQYNSFADQVLDGTTWKEINTLGTITFAAGTRMSGVDLFGYLNNNVYQRQAATISPTLANSYFFVLMADGKTMKAINKVGFPYHRYILAKQ